MAQELLERVQFARGTITNNPLLSGDTTISSGDFNFYFSYLGTLPAGYRIAICLDPFGLDNGPEWVFVTAHGVGSNDVTAVRGRRGTTAAQHAQGTQWIASVGPIDVPQTIVKNASESVTSSIALQSDNDLFFPVYAGHRYKYEFTLFVDGATGGDILLDLNAPAATTGRWNVLGQAQGTTTQEGSMRSEGSTSFATAGLGFGAVTTPSVITIHGVAYPTNDGSISLRWAQRVSSGTATRILEGSSVTFQEF